MSASDSLQQPPPILDPLAQVPGGTRTCPVCDAGRAEYFLHVGDSDYWRCVGCLATFLDPAQLPAAATELAHYHSHRNDPADRGYRAFLGRLAEPLLARLAPGARGLDYGCGPGPALAAILGEAGHPTAIYDPFFAPDESVLRENYDFITCTEVIEHFHRPGCEFARLAALLVPGGWLGLMTEFQTDDARFAKWYYRRDPTHVVFYREQTLRHLATRWGWHCEIPRPNVALLRKPG